MASIRKIKQNNEQQFLIDLKRCSGIMVFTEKTRDFFKIRKGELLKKAETSEIRYYVTDKIFKARRNSMVII